MDAALGHNPNPVANPHQRPRTGENRAETPFDGNESTQLRAGFGQGTVTAPAAALQALNRGVRAAAETTPSLEELQAAQRAFRAEDHKPAQEKGLERPLRGEVREVETTYDRKGAPRAEAKETQRPQPASRPEQANETRSTEPVPEPTAPATPAPTGPNALSRQRLNVLA